MNDDIWVCSYVVGHDRPEVVIHPGTDAVVVFYPILLYARMNPTKMQVSTSA